jgi:hypothetical protein
VIATCIGSWISRENARRRSHASRENQTEKETQLCDV